MSNSIATLPTSPDQITQALANVSIATANVGGGDGSFMKFSKGEYLFGTDDLEAEEGSHWAVNPMSFKHGYQCWGLEGSPDAGTLLGEEVVGMTEAPVVKSQLPQLNGKWADIIGFNMVCITGSDEGTEVYISGSSMGFVKAAKKLIQTLTNHMNEDSTTPVAVLDLKVDSYKHKKYGKIYTPIFDVVDWKTLDATAASEPEAEKPEAPVEKAKEPEDKPAPTRRRRRAAK
tara:strand:- start:60 stop:752 length:693 start_codon:yes stop_codon:yes gene_type:complete